jgi:hypothetical protein
MSAVPAVIMQDLELEHAGLLPSRETLRCCHPHGDGGSNVFQSVATGNSTCSGFLQVAILTATSSARVPATSSGST